ncbi:MAG: tRNA (N6-isopentenyl adenosine(37)-C2)-methylthiotransferase MiaB [Reinekea sp.]
MTKKLFIKTHGCQMNEYDSDRMADLLGESHGYELTNDENDADIILLNTCSIREKAQEKVFHQLGRWKTLKEKKPGLKIGVGGCVASQEGEAISKRAPHVDMIFGPQTLHRLPQMIDATDAAAKQQNKHIALVDITFPEIEKFDHLPAPKSDGVSAFVSVMEGCSKYCTFCVVPYTRGEEVSRPFDDVIAEVAHLAAQGVREINFLGQNVNAYRGARHNGGEADLAELITLTAQIDGIDRIRFTTSHPVEFSDSLIDVYKDVPELVSHLHLPVQSGSDQILAAMKRGHKAEEYVSKMERIRANRPDISFSSEKQRLQVLQQRIIQQASQISQRMVGTTQIILVTGPSERNPADLCGRTENNRNTFFTCDDHSLIGKFVQVQITEAYANSLRCEIVNADLAY